MSHIPILVDEIMQHMPDKMNLYLDGTFGRGGHLRHVLQTYPQARAVAIDKDLEAIAYAKATFGSEIQSGRVHIVHADYVEIEKLIAEGRIEKGPFDAVLLDLGVSSPQFDLAERGFSFLHNGPLDMRMNQNQTTTAQDLIHELSEEDMIELFKKYGEIEKPARVVRAIVHDRKEKKFDSTHELAGLIERVEGWKKKGIHPATKYFMALRIQVNNELEHLEPALKSVMTVLREGGRLFVITFHSLEDRIVKQVFQSSLDQGFPVNKRVISPSESEQKSNPRSRSAKLRIFERSSEGGRSYGKKKNKYADRKGH